VTGEKSRLPDGPDYWDALARTVLADAEQVLAGYAVQPRWDGVLARQAPWLAAACAAAMLALSLALPAPVPPLAGAWVEDALAPDDSAGALAAGAEPPRVEILLAQFPTEQKR
jgi:hypothetical protein